MKEFKYMTFDGNPGSAPLFLKTILGLDLTSPAQPYLLKKGVPTGPNFIRGCSKPAFLTSTAGSGNPQSFLLNWSWWRDDIRGPLK